LAMQSRAGDHAKTIAKDGDLAEELADARHLLGDQLQRAGI